MNHFNFVHKIRNKIKVHKSTQIHLGTNIKIVGCTITSDTKNDKIFIDDNTILRDVKIEPRDNSSIIIGKDCMIGHNSYLVAKESTKLSIGDDCGLSRNLTIMTSDGHPIYKDGKLTNSAQDIKVENHIWIAENVSILKGVTIQSGSVIGMNSTVVKNVPNNAISAGNPAKIVKEGITWES